MRSRSLESLPRLFPPLLQPAPHQIPPPSAPKPILPHSASAALPALAHPMSPSSLTLAPPTLAPPTLAPPTLAPPTLAPPTLAHPALAVPCAVLRVWSRCGPVLRDTVAPRCRVHCRLSTVPSGSFVHRQNPSSNVHAAKPQHCDSQGAATQACLFLTRVKIDAHQKYLPLFSIRVATQQMFVKRLFFRTSQQIFLTRVNFDARQNPVWPPLQPKQNVVLVKGGLCTFA